MTSKIAKIVAKYLAREVKKRASEDEPDRGEWRGDYTLTPVGTTPVYTFRQTEVALPSATVIMVIATNQYGFGQDYVQVYANCYK